MGIHGEVGCSRCKNGRMAPASSEHELLTRPKLPRAMSVVR